MAPYSLHRETFEVETTEGAMIPWAQEQHKIMIQVKGGLRAYVLACERVLKVRVYRQWTSNDPRIFNLCITCRKVVSFMLAPTLTPDSTLEEFILIYLIKDQISQKLNISYYCCYFKTFLTWWRKIHFKHFYLDLSSMHFSCDLNESEII